MEPLHLYLQLYLPPSPTLHYRAQTLRRSHLNKRITATCRTKRTRSQIRRSLGRTRTGATPRVRDSRRRRANGERGRAAALAVATDRLDRGERLTQQGRLGRPQPGVQRGRAQRQRVVGSHSKGVGVVARYLLGIDRMEERARDVALAEEVDRGLLCMAPRRR